MNKVLIMIIITNLVIISYVSLKPTKEIKRNWFYKVHSHVQKIVKNLFILFKTNLNYTSNQKTRLLLKMHAAMKLIAKRNFEIYKHLKTAAKLNTQIEPKDGLFDSNNLIQILITENLVPDHNITLFSKPGDNSGIHLNRTSLEIPEKSKESFAFLREYFYNIGDPILPKAVDSPLNIIKNSYFKHKKIRNLKKWGASNITGARNHAVNDTRRIFHGASVSIRRFPFVASVHVMGDFVCGGSIINREMIITAATCVQIAYNNSHFLKNNKDGIAVRVGSDYSQRFGDLCYVSNVFFYPAFDPVSLRNNLAILKFKTLLHFRKKNKIRRIDYHYVRGPLPKNVTRISMLGWGDKDVGSSNVFERLSLSKIDVYNLETCKNIYSRKFVTDDNFCAGFESTGSGACQRDIGGPAIFNSKLVGVTSFGPPTCGMPDAPTTFTDLGQYVDWIDSIVKTIQVNQNEIKYTPKTLPQTQMIDQQHVEVLKKTGLKSKLDKNIEKLRAETNPRHIQIFNYVLNLLVGEKDASISITDYENNEEKEYSDEKKAEKFIPNENMQVAASSFKTKHYSRFTTKIKAINKHDKFNYNSKLKNINQTSKELLYRAMKDLGYLGLSDIIERRKTDRKKQLQSLTYTTSQTSPVKKQVSLKPQKIWKKDNKLNRKEIESPQTHKVIKPVTHYHSSKIIETDNYESDPNDGLSIEIPSEIPLAQAVAVMMSTTKSIAISNKLMSSQRGTNSEEIKRYRIVTKTTPQFVKQIRIRHKVTEHKPPESNHKTRGVVARNSDTNILRQEEFENITYILNDSSNDENTGSEIHSSSLEQAPRYNPKTSDEFTHWRSKEKQPLTHSEKQQLETTTDAVIKSNYLKPRKPLTANMNRVITKSERKQNITLQEEPLSYAQQKQMDTSHRHKIKQNHSLQNVSKMKTKQKQNMYNYPSIIDRSTNGNKSLGKTTMPSITFYYFNASAANASLPRIKFADTVVKIRSTSSLEETIIGSTQDVYVPRYVPLTSYEHYPQYIGDDEYNDYQYIH